MQNMSVQFLTGSYMYFSGSFRNLCLYASFFICFIVRSDFAHASDNFMLQSYAVMGGLSGKAVVGEQEDA